MYFPIRFLLGALAVAYSFSVWATEPVPNFPVPDSDTLEANNKWSVRISNSLKLNAPLYVTLRQVGNHWDIVGLFDVSPELKRSEDLELFMATRDLQQWTNVYTDMRTDCDQFEVRESDFHSVCTSRLAEKKTGMAVAGLFFGGSGKVPFAYTDDKVKAAINSIRPQQAMKMLTAFEQGTLRVQNQAQAIAVSQQKERSQVEEARAAARKVAPLGAKDWCEQTVKYFGIIMQVEQTYTCQNYGVVTEDNLRNEGWAIVNKKERKVGYAPQLVIINDIAIEKVPH